MVAKLWGTIEMQMRKSMQVAMAILLCSLASCQNQNDPVGVSGRVTLNGKPLPSGIILLESVDTTRGQNRQCPIEEGVFCLPDTEGILPGTEFRVVILAFRKTGRRLPYANPDGTWDETEQYLPAKYNTETTLKVTAAPGTATNEYTFDLQSRPGRK